MRGKRDDKDKTVVTLSEHQESLPLAKIVAGEVVTLSVPTAKSMNG